MVPRFRSTPFCSLVYSTPLSGTSNLPCRHRDLSETRIRSGLLFELHHLLAPTLPAWVCLPPLTSSIPFFYKIPVTGQTLGHTRKQKHTKSLKLNWVLPEFNSSFLASLLFLKYLFIVCFVCTIYVQEPPRPEESVRSPESEVMGIMAYNGGSGN